MTYLPLRRLRFAAAVALFVSPLISNGASTGITDTLVFGAGDSETAHAVSAEHSDTITAAWASRRGDCCRWSRRVGKEGGFLSP